MDRFREEDMKTSWRTAAALGLVISASGLFASCSGPNDPQLITTDEIAGHIKFLSDDLLEGRAVGGRGIELAARYQEDYFKTFGLEPAFGTGYSQVFPLRGVTTDPAMQLEVLASPRIVAKPYEEFVVATERVDSPEEVSGELVYCGYMIQAPEKDWDDIKGLDLHDKILLCEINEPGNRPGGNFEGEDMTYYGRWTYKFEKAAELGAAGVLIIHNDKGAAYDWEVLRNGWTKERFFLPDKSDPLPFEGWISEPLAETVFKAARLDRQALLAKAETVEFAPVATGLRVVVRQRPTFRTVEAKNVAGIVRAKNRHANGRMIIVSAHYDHLGKNNAVEGDDKIYNGAVDNCSASASMLVLASYYAQRPEELRDDVCFVGVTAEEEGLLGSDYFARHLPFPADKVLADINFEMTNVWGETEDVFAIGGAYSGLDQVCREAAEGLGLEYTMARNGHLGFLFRSDQLSFIRAGIPAVWLHQGIRSREGDRDAVLRAFEDYEKTKYHKVTDEFNPNWDLRGTVQIINWARGIINRLSDRKEAPRLPGGSPFSRKTAPAGERTV